MAEDRTPGQGQREFHARVRDARAVRHREKFGRLAPITERIDGEGEYERAQRRGAEGEELVGRRLEKHLSAIGALVLHDLRVPGTHANIDHICIGPRIVMVVDAKAWRGKVDVRRGTLVVNGRRRTKPIDGVLRQIDVVKSALDDAGLWSVEVRGSLAMANTDGLPTLKRLRVDGIEIAATRRISKLVKGTGGPGHNNVALIADVLRARLVP